MKKNETDNKNILKDFVDADKLTGSMDTCDPSFTDVEQVFIDKSRMRELPTMKDKILNQLLDVKYPQHNVFLFTFYAMVTGVFISVTRAWTLIFTSAFERFMFLAVFLYAVKEFIKDFRVHIEGYFVLAYLPLFYLWAVNYNYPEVCLGISGAIIIVFYITQIVRAYKAKNKI